VIRIRIVHEDAKLGKDLNRAGECHNVLEDLRIVHAVAWNNHVETNSLWFTGRDVLSAAKFSNGGLVLSS
jgi:hypothetical protein